MLIGTLPTVTSDRSLALVEEIIAHPSITAVRYNTGGGSPLEPLEILEKIKRITDYHDKPLYVDLEGRQMRIARWTPFDAGSITLNRDFRVTPPARIYIRNAGWFDVSGAHIATRRLFIENGPALRNYYFGESQSAHVVGGHFKIKGFLGGLDSAYIEAAQKLQICHFMLSFVEEEKDVQEFYACFSKKERGNLAVILKIESKNGVQLIKQRPMIPQEHLMAARDDLFVSFGDKPVLILEALKDIITCDPFAIVASRILQGLWETRETTMGDIADIALMFRLGYRNFMFSDEAARQFSEIMSAWNDISTFLKTNEGVLWKKE